VFKECVIVVVLISSISVVVDEYEIELAGDMTVVGRETSVSVSVIMDMDGDPGCAAMEDPLPGT